MDERWRVAASGGAPPGDAPPGAPAPKVVASTAWTGAVLLGQVERDGGWAGERWLSDLDVSWEAGLLAHHHLPSAWLPDVAPLQVVYVSDPQDRGRAWLEVSYLPLPDGSVRVLLDAGGGAGPDGGLSWASAVAVGRWDDGMPVTSMRLTVRDGVARLDVEGTVVDEGPVLGAATELPPPPAGAPVTIGPDAGAALPVRSVRLLDGLDGRPLLTFLADDAGGWAPTGLEGGVTGPPTAAAFVGTKRGGWRVPPSSVFDLGPDDDRTWWCHLRPVGTAGSTTWLAQGDGHGDGFRFLHFPAFGAPNSFGIRFGGDVVRAGFGPLRPVDQVLAAVLDRARARLTTYVDGVEVTSVDASAVGSVRGGGLTAFAANALVYAAGVVPVALDAGAIRALGA